jgi:hypothetical protein
MSACQGSTFLKPYSTSACSHLPITSPQPKHSARAVTNLSVILATLPRINRSLYSVRDNLPFSEITVQTNPLPP